MSGSDVGHIAYLITAEELYLLGRLIFHEQGDVRKRFEERIPAPDPGTDWNEALNGLLEKNYAAKAAGSIVYDRVIGVLARLIVESERTGISEDGTVRLFIHPDAAVCLCADARRTATFKLMAMKSEEEFRASGDLANTKLEWQ